MSNNTFDFDEALKKLQEPENYSGIWFSLHTFAITCDDVKRPDVFNAFLRSTVSQLKCSNCREHAIQYVLENEVNMDISDYQHNYLFYWTVDFHNTVNARIGKPVISHDDAEDLFHSQICTDCGDKGDDIVEDDISSKYEVIHVKSPGIITRDLDGNELPIPLVIKPKAVLINSEQHKTEKPKTTLNRKPSSRRRR